MMSNKPQRKPFKQIIAEDFAALETYLLADDRTVDEVWERRLADSELLKTFIKKISREIKGFNLRYNINQTSAEANSLSVSYTGEVLTNLRKQCQAKNDSVIEINEISKKLHFSLRRVDDFLRKLFDIPYPPKPLVRLYHLRKYTLKAIDSNPRAKALSEANISSFLSKLRDSKNQTEKFIYDRLSDDLRQRLSGIVWENLSGKIQNDILRLVCDELNSLIKEYDGAQNEEKQIKHQPPLMFFDEFSGFVRDEEKIRYTVPLTNRYKNREILSRVFPEISFLETVNFAEINENISSDKSQTSIGNFESIEELVKSLEQLFNLFVKLPRVTSLVKDFWARVEYCVSQHCGANPEIYLFKFLEYEGKWTDKSMNDAAIKECILVFSSNNQDRFRYYKLILRKAWKRVSQGNGKELYEQVRGAI